MPILYDLLCNGYFPRELPPTFNTSAFADLILSRGPSSSPDFSSGKCDALICEHSIPRSRTMRRKIGIPNPITQLLLCKELDNNWAELKNHIDLSPISLSKPWQNGTSLRAFLPHNNQGSLPQLRAKYRMGAKYLLKTDITNYYNSIYTHSIPWALHTKTISKEKRGINELLGNKLDYLVRNCRDCQTSGIPTGPDTSFLLSEILLSSIDREIANKLNGIKFKGFRYMDDYELCFSNYHDSEFALNQIDSALAEYGLGLNPKKTTIRKLPVPLEEYWVHELKTFGFREKAIAQKNDIISYFSRAFELSEQYPEQSVLRYAIAKFRSINVEISVWPLLRTLLLECVSSEPGTIQYVLELLVRFSNKGYEIKLTQLGEILNDQIISHAPLDHGSEVAWALWGSIAFEVPLDATASSKVSEMNDSIVALLGLDAEQRGLFEESLNKDNWSRYMDKKELYREQWLLCYEANIKKWIPNSGRDHVNMDPRFNYLKKNGVQFYHTSKGEKIIPQATQSLVGGNNSVSM